MLLSSVQWSHVDRYKWAGTNAIEGLAVSTLRVEGYQTTSLHRSENHNVNNRSLSHENLKSDISRKWLKETSMIANVWNERLCLIHSLVIHLLSI
jgi:hypothetical protein